MLEIYSNAFDYIRDKNNSEEDILKKYEEVAAIPIMEKENKYKAFLLNNVAYRCSDKNKKFEYLTQANILYPTSKNIALSASQTKRIEKQLKELIDAMSKYKENK